MPRLDATSSQQIIKRFEELEKRLRLVERRQASKTEQKPVTGIHVQIDGEVFELQEVPTSDLRAEVEKQRMKLLEEEPLVSFGCLVCFFVGSF